MIIGITGKKGAGKDTVADILTEYGFVKKSFAQPLKESLRIMFNFSDEQLYGEKKEEIDSRWNISPRNAMQFFGTDILRKMDEDFWIKHMEQRLTEKLIVIPDVRFSNEIEVIKKRGGYILGIRGRGIDDTHESENQKLKVDFMIDNSHSLDHLRDEIVAFLKIYT